MKTCLRNDCPNQLTNPRSKYCSRECFNIAKPRIDRNRRCQFCGQLFKREEAEQKFCNRSCSAKFNNKLRESKRECKGCQTLIDWRVKGDYCKIACRQDHEITLWLAGELNGCWKYTHAGYVRRHLDKKTGGKCEECGYNKTRPDGSSILQVDHIDGNWQNNRPENVRLLCPNCHALTPTWGAGNMGNGRSWKKDYDQYAPKGGK